MGFIAALGRFNRGIERALNVVLLLLLAGFILLILYQIASRNLGVLPTVHATEELSRFAFQWMIMLGTAIGVLHADHFVLEAFARHTWMGRLTRVLRDLACLSVGVIFIVFGQAFAASGFNRIASASQLPMVVTYSAFLVCGVLIVLFSLQRLLLGATRGMDVMEGELDTPSNIDETAPPTADIDTPPTARNDPQEKRS
ncbi:TRAP transporter small permease [Kushneria indalinina]|uniref:TRAP transporter small permease protein n=1 Tax=Kushneria indalinina DSM 14324 TaxID=1122140 RepID=A0A3D9DS60_9GAMM|nr:TRAP transporter small permease [Kushneria indalinina]REC93608.1 TRAP-type C4-dicarboxylate transport system permease small subunit [Kushneria indalinina DSM 14324]